MSEAVAHATDPASSPPASSMVVFVDHAKLLAHLHTHRPHPPRGPKVLFPFFPSHSPSTPSTFFLRSLPQIRTSSSASGTGFSSAEDAASASQSDNRAPIASIRN
eukprot:CAMPEP_0113920532 /NCGR_PEP_ID=MMETSP1159-20121227/597_1 /TAXON_ID=88271 /ORGANISM="Picocystis salinarum" /LENGTH=104 /DNA_ID=CAMNT_0000920515 /DNA_START=557 /DNA_END=868 /DNA_ORIENTATION=+ /assembly_acc=CAM_ASM_000767